MRRFLAQFRGSEPLCHTRSLAGFITITSGFRFSVHTGASRIHGELLKLGFEIAQSTVSKYMVRGHRPPSQSWKAFLHNHADAIAAIDLFMVPTVTFDLLYAFLVVGQTPAAPVVRCNPTSDRGVDCTSDHEAFPWASGADLPGARQDRALRAGFHGSIAAMGIRDRPIAPGSHWQNGIAERLIGRFVASVWTTSLFLERHTCAACYLLMQSTTIKRARIDPSRRTHQYAEPLNGSAPLPLSRSRADSIINTSGYDFRKGQGHPCLFCDVWPRSALNKKREQIVLPHICSVARCN